MPDSFSCGSVFERTSNKPPFFCNLICFKTCVYNPFLIYSIENSIIMSVVYHSVYKFNASTVCRANVNY
jgi:hypothetical protein